MDSKIRLYFVGARLVEHLDSGNHGHDNRIEVHVGHPSLMRRRWLVRAAPPADRTGGAVIEEVADDPVQSSIGFLVVAVARVGACPRVAGLSEPR